MKGMNFQEPTGNRVSLRRLVKETVESLLEIIDMDLHSSVFKLSQMLVWSWVTGKDKL